MVKETPIPLPPRRFASTNLNTKKPSIDPSAIVTEAVVAPKPQIRKTTPKAITTAKETPIPLPPKRSASTTLDTKKPTIDTAPTLTETVVPPMPQVRKTATKSISKKPAPKKAKPKDSIPTPAPIYDSLGYELSPTRIQRASRRYRKPSNYEAYEARMQKEREEQIRKCEIMGTPREKVSAMTLMAWDDRVARELGIEYHKVEMKHFEELKRRGFVAKEGEFEAKNISEEERERIRTLATGSAFRR